MPARTSTAGPIISTSSPTWAAPTPGSISRHDRPHSRHSFGTAKEESKGTDLTRAAHALLKDDRRLNYIGYVEGKELFKGDIDVAVTDGFTGNVVLKSLEGLGKTVSQILRNEPRAHRHDEGRRPVLDVGAQ